LIFAKQGQRGLNEPTMHCSNERISMDRLKTGAKIFALRIMDMLGFSPRASNGEKETNQ